MRGVARFGHRIAEVIGDALAVARVTTGANAVAELENVRDCGVVRHVRGLRDRVGIDTRYAGHPEQVGFDDRLLAPPITAGGLEDDRGHAAVMLSVRHRETKLLKQ